MIQRLRGTLADIAFSKDMTLRMARGKAARLYWQLVVLTHETPGELEEARAALAKLEAAP